MSSNNTMKAFAALHYGGPEVLEEIELPIPQPQGRDILVRIHSGATNPVDYKKLNNFGNLQGKPEPPLIVGYDAAGVVQAVGPDTTLYKVGDHVFFAGVFTRSGTFAEYTLVDERIVGIKPKALSFDQAATIPLVALTAWEGLVEELHLQHPQNPEEEKRNASKTLLVIGGAGGVGSLAIQLAKHVLKLKVIATASRPETVEWCKSLGADVVISHYEPFAPQLKQHGISGVDYAYNAIDTVKYFDELAGLVNPLGGIVNINGTDGAPLDIGKLMFKRISFHFELMFTRPLFSVEPEKQKATLDLISGLLDRKVIRHPLTRTFPFTLAGLREALELQRSGKAIGKFAFTVTQ